MSGVDTSREAVEAEAQGLERDASATRAAASSLANDSDRVMCALAASRLNGAAALLLALLARAERAEAERDAAVRVCEVTQEMLSRPNAEGGWLILTTDCERAAVLLNAWRAARGGGGNG